MSETDRDAVERHLDINVNHEAGLIPAASENLIRALLAAKEAAEAERDEVIADLKTYMQIATDEANRAQSAEAELRCINARLKIKGGTADAPTQWAYDQACAALDKHKAEAAALREALEKYQDAINQSRLALAGYVSAQSAIDKIDTIDQPKEGDSDE